MPAIETVLNPACAAEIVYVSGASERKRNLPEASVVTRPIWDGLVAVTSAPAIGARVTASTTVPAIVPVVPAITGAQTDSSAAATNAQPARFRNELLMHPPPTEQRPKEALS